MSVFSFISFIINEDIERSDSYIKNLLNHTNYNINFLHPNKKYITLGDVICSLIYEELRLKDLLEVLYWSVINGIPKILKKDIDNIFEFDFKKELKINFTLPVIKDNELITIYNLAKVLQFPFSEYTNKEIDFEFSKLTNMVEDMNKPITIEDLDIEIIKSNKHYVYLKKETTRTILSILKLNHY